MAINDELKLTRQDWRLDGRIGSLFWLMFLFIPILSQREGWPARHEFLQQVDALRTVLAVLAYLPLHFFGFYQRGPRLWLIQALTFVLGLWLLPYNAFAHTLFIYAGLPWERASRREALVGMCVVVLMALLVFQYYEMSWGYVGLVAGLIFGIGSSILADKTAQLAKQQVAAKDVEIARLAKMAERERIARDLHDLLGHTLSLIAIKSELAQKLAEREPGRAAGEMQEVAGVARQALAEVRQAILALRSLGVQEALQRGQAMLQAAGITVELDLVPLPPLDEAREHALAQALIEACTNVVRHAQASHCHIALQLHGEQLQLAVSDDGVGCQAVPGNGLRGMSERLEALGGKLQLGAPVAGAALQISLPLAS